MMGQNRSSQVVIVLGGAEQSGSHCAGSATKSQTENRTEASSHNGVYRNREKEIGRFQFDSRQVC
jgi:hypothetical protein